MPTEQYLKLAREAVGPILFCELDIDRATVDDLISAFAEVIEKSVAEAVRGQNKEWAESPAYATFVELKHGVVGAILRALQDGRISRGRASECLSEVAHGSKEVILPDLSGVDFIEESELPSAIAAERDRLQLENAELLKDKARLDWLEARRLALNKYNGTTYGWKVVLSHNVTRLMANLDASGTTVDLHDSSIGNRDIRSAINEAMADAELRKKLEGKV